MSKKELIEDQKRAIGQLNTELQFLESLPETVDVATLYKVGGDWHLGIKGVSPDTALTLFPPKKVFLKGAGTSSDPFVVATATPETPSQVLADGTDLAFPTELNSRGELRWATSHTVASVLQPVVITLANCRDFAIAGYTRTPAGAQNFNQVFLRTRIDPVVEATTNRQSPLDLFNQKWDEVLTPLALNTKQMLFARAIKSNSERGSVLTMEALPTKTAIEEYSESSPLSPMKRMGNFWGCFTDEQAQTLIHAANSISAEVGGSLAVREVEEKHIQQLLQEAKSLLLKFADNNLRSCKTRPHPDVLEYLANKELGTKLSISFRDCRRGPGLNEISYDFWIYYRRWNEGLTLVLPDRYDPKGFDWMTPDFVKYEPLEPVTV
jgi:hypothetical protein